MTDVPDGPGVYLNGDFTAAEWCGPLSRELGRTLKLAHGAPGKPPPSELLVDHLAQLHAAAGLGTWFRDVSAGHADARNRQEFRGEASSPSSGQPVKRLTPAEAARAVNVSAEYMRRLCRRGVLGTRDEIRSSWFIDSRELAAWEDSRRRKGDKRRAA